MTQRERRFMWAVQALAQPASVQMSLYPAFAEVADELALEFEETHANFAAAHADDLDPRRHEVISRLDQTILSMSGPEKPFWTVEALHSSPEWERIRALAQEVLVAMGWPATVPPEERGAVYVGSDA